MKIAFFPIIFCFISTIGFSQPLPQKGDYIKKPELVNFAGTWQGINGSDTFTIVLQYKQKMQLGPLFADAIVGWHKYSQGGVTESNSMSDPLDISKKTITISASYKGDVFAIFYDPNPNVSRSRVNVSFTFVPGKTDEAIWKVKSFEEEAHDLYIEGRPRKVRPPASKLTAIPQWHLKKIN